MGTSDSQPVGWKHRDPLDLGLGSEVGWGQSLVGSDATSRETVSELSESVGHPTGVAENCPVGETPRHSVTAVSR